MESKEGACLSRETLKQATLNYRQTRKDRGQSGRLPATTLPCQKGFLLVSHSSRTRPAQGTARVRVRKRRGPSRRRSTLRIVCNLAFLSRGRQLTRCYRKGSGIYIRQGGVLRFRYSASTFMLLLQITNWRRVDGNMLMSLRDLQTSTCPERDIDTDHLGILRVTLFCLVKANSGLPWRPCVC